MNYTEKMEMLQKAKKVEVGDKISCQGITCTVGEIFYSDRYVEEKNGKYEVFYDVEFKDTNNNYRHWKSYFDGGKLLTA